MVGFLAMPPTYFKFTIRTIEQALNPFSFLKYFLFDNIFYFKKLIFNIKSKNTKNIK